jgi:hypothetical protein
MSGDATALHMMQLFGMISDVGVEWSGVEWSGVEWSDGSVV